MRRRHDHGVGLQPVDDDSVSVDGAPDDLETERLDPLVLPVQGRILDGHTTLAPVTQHAEDDVEPLRGPLYDHDLRRVGDDAPRSAKVIRQRLPQAEVAARVAVFEGARGSAPRSVLQRRQPLREREQRHVGCGRRQVEPVRTTRRLSTVWPARRRSSDGRDDRRLAGLRDDEPLGLELGVDVAGDAARDA